ncbi:MAG TPA: TraB/GumN family protein [Spirochaetia bacterium]|nr:TraB/GumN family protein [Spirochaetales bacterium]HRW24328.1 TraB/GumN family protein [Spirochaetia bacterium]
MSDTIKALELSGRRIVLVGTAHVSRESVDEVAATIRDEAPDGVCVELDEARWRSMSAPDAWEKTDIVKVIKEGRAFLLLANLALSSFQRRMGMDSGVKPGEEMVAAIRAAEAAGIPFSFCDRDVQTTLRRAWGKSNLWNKSKLLAQLIAAAFSNEKPDAAEIERLKVRSELDEMMGELADYLPSVKEVLIDERDRYIAAKIWTMPGEKLVAVIGAGHAPGVEAWLARFAEGALGNGAAGGDAPSTDVSDLERVPPPGILARSAGWLVPALIVGFIVLGFFTSGAEASLRLLLRWVALNGTLAAVGSVLCLSHPLTVLVSFAAAPIATLNPLVAVGFFAGIVEAWLRKPQVSDFQTLSTDVSSLKGFYRNKVTHILLVFFLSSLGGALGNFIALPFLAGGAL